MSGVFHIIDSPPPHRPVSVYPPAFGAGEDTLARRRGGGGSIVRKTPDTALYSICVSTLWLPGKGGKQNSGGRQAPDLAANWPPPQGGWVGILFSFSSLGMRGPGHRMS
jgi:hypothetical protein